MEMKASSDGFFGQLKLTKRPLHQKLGNNSTNRIAFGYLKTPGRICFQSCSYIYLVHVYKYCEILKSYPPKHHPLPSY